MIENPKSKGEQPKKKAKPFTNHCPHLQINRLSLFSSLPFPETEKNQIKSIQFNSFLSTKVPYPYPSKRGEKIRVPNQGRTKVWLSKAFGGVNWISSA